MNVGEEEPSMVGGIKESLQSEAIFTQLGPMVSQQLTTTLEGKTEAELHELAVALLLEHFGAVTPQFREAILTALKDQKIDVMKWIQDLPSDFTQDFRFTVSGVENPQAWLHENIKPGTWDLNETVSLGRDEILGKEILKNSLATTDVGEVIEMSMMVSHMLEGEVKTEVSYAVNNTIRYISFAGEWIESVPELSSLTGLMGLNFSKCLTLTDLSGLADISGLCFLKLQECESLRDFSVISELQGLEELNISHKTLTQLPPLSGLVSLATLNLSHCHSLSDVSQFSICDILTH